MSMNDVFNSKVVIVGAGQAGATASMELRKLGHVGHITLIGDEPHPPYERPPLSKDALVRPETTQIHIREASHYTSIDVDLRLATSVVRVEADQRHIVLETGESLTYDFLILATGARARRLPQLDALGERVHTLRSIADVQRLRLQLLSGRKVVLVGAGVVGLELASSLVDLGLRVELIDQASRVMSRNAPEFVSTLLQGAHEQRGLRFHLGVSIAAAQCDDHELWLSLSNGSLVRGDLLVYGVGVVVNDALAHSAGLELVHGAVLVNDRCESSKPEILVVGDATICRSASGVLSRLETWENANLQGVIAARTILSRAPDTAISVPWFWTDQCGMNCQFAGDMSAPDWVMRGALQTSGFTALGLRDGMVVAAVTVNQGRDMRPARELIAKTVALPRHVLADEGLNLRNIARNPDQFA